MELGTRRLLHNNVTAHPATEVDVTAISRSPNRSTFLPIRDTRQRQQFFKGTAMRPKRDFAIGRSCLAEHYPTDRSSVVPFLAFWLRLSRENHNQALLNEPPDDGKLARIV